ncbi:MAG: DUF2232 domain-containing protein [Bdellovibrio sp.]
MEKNFRSGLRSILLCLLASFVTLLFNFMGGPFIKLARSTSGPLIFWVFFVFLGSLFLFPASAPLALIIVPFWLSVGLYHEAERRAWGNFWSLSLVVLVSGAFSAAIPWFLSNWFDMRVVDALLQGLREQFDSFKKSPSMGLLARNWSFDLMLKLVPGLFLSLLVVNLAVALALEKGVARLLRIQLNRPAFALRLLDFRVPEPVIWILIGSGALTLLRDQTDMSIWGWNLLILLLVVYFFQGLAVLEFAFLVFRWGFFLRLALYLLLVGNLPFVLSGVGIADYWLDFRVRLRSWANRQKAAKG